MQVNQDTEAKLVQTKNDFEKSKDMVVEKMIKAITTVKPTLHENARPVKA
jgi:V-type H+-transporting ATPase subunit G